MKRAGAAGMRNLRRALTERLSHDEIKDLAFNLGYEPEDGQSKPNTIRDLLIWAVRRDRLKDLIAVTYVLNPQIDMESALAKDVLADLKSRGQGHSLPYPPLKSPPAVVITEDASGAATPARKTNPVKVLALILRAIPEWSDVEERETILILMGLSAARSRLDLDGSPKETADRLVAHCLTYGQLSELCQGLLDYATLTDSQTSQLNDALPLLGGLVMV